MKARLIYLSAQVGKIEALLIKRHYAGQSQWTVLHGTALSEEELAQYDSIAVYGHGSVPAALQRLPRFPIDDLLQNNEPEALPAAFQQKRIVAVTSCPTGVAHTFMAAEALQLGAEQLNYRIQVETQGSVGAGNVLRSEDIAAADVVLIAADTHVDLQRFAGKKIHLSGTKAAIHNGAALIEEALQQGKIQSPKALPAAEQQGSSPAASSIYQHLMTGVSHMLPFVVAGGLLIALGFALGSYFFGADGIHVYRDEYASHLAYKIFWLGKAAFALFVPVLAAYIGHSIGGRPALAPAMIGGYLSSELGAGFLGAIVAGFFAGHAVAWLNRHIRLGRSLEALKPTLILPLLGTLVVGLLMYYVVGEPAAKATQALESWLKGMQEAGGAHAVLLGALLGGMMALDMGGPVNKAAYSVSVALIGSGVFTPMAAVMAAGMTPPLALFCATLLFRNRFTVEEREAGKAAGVLGLSFITEGAIPFAAKDPLRVIPALVAGSALTGALSMLWGCALQAPHGGLFVLFIPNAINELGAYLLAIAAGTALTAFLLGLFKPALKGASNP